MFMKMKKAFAAAFLIAGIGATSANAEQALNFSFTSTPLGDGSLVQWIMHLDTPGPLKVSGIDLTINGTLNQITTIGPITVGDTTFMDSNAQIVQLATLLSLPISPAYDTQFLFSEQNVVTTPELAGENASKLFGSFAFQEGSAAAPFLSRDIAQIVLPVGMTASYSGFIAIGGIGGSEVAVSGTVGAVVDPSGPAINIGTDAVAGALELDGGGDLQVADLGGVDKGAVHLVGWHNVSHHNLYLDINPGNLSLDDILVALNEALGTDGTASAIPGGMYRGIDANVAINFPTRPFGDDDLYLEFDLSGVGDGSALLNVVAVPAPAAAFAGMALLGGLGLARRFRKD